MPRIESSRALLPSILDRLIDQEPQTSSEAKAQAVHLVRDLRTAVRRDLEALLNTRWRCLPWPAEFDQLEHSVLAYGVPDPSSLSLAYERGREDFMVKLKSLIETFEPRLTRVRVIAEKVDESKEHTLRFRIEAVLNAHADPEAITFTSRLEPVRRSFEVRM
jgi:type VI secretion system protein ImpF